MGRDINVLALIFLYCFKNIFKVELINLWYRNKFPILYFGKSCRPLNYNAQRHGYIGEGKTSAVFQMISRSQFMPGTLFNELSC